MPYIKENERKDIVDKITGNFFRCLREHKEPTIEGIFESITRYPGELNYIITLLCHLHITNSQHKLNYQNLNEVIGVLECAKQELYHMVAAKYEDKKRLENGAISELDSIGLDEVR